MRLTRGNKELYYYTNGAISSGIVYIDDKNFTNACINKLGQCEDIEEKHNIKSLDDLDDRLTAFEIIKEKEVNVYMLKWYFTYSSYEEYARDFERNRGDCDLPDLSDRLLTQEEYDLLKEALL